MREYRYVDSPIGRLLLIGVGEILEELHFPNSSTRKERDDSSQLNDNGLTVAYEQLSEYFQGTRTQFSIKLQPKGTDFQKKVWQQLSKIPYGETTHYGEIAKRIGNPKGSRAVGLANGKNPIPIIVPCHRVIGKDGSLTGFGGGLEIKKQLLALEKLNR